MHTIIGERGTGKTTKIFQLAKEINAIVLCPNSRALRQKAKALGYEDIEIIGFGDLDNDNYSFDKPVLIDEAAYILEGLLNKYYNLKMAGFSATIENPD